MEKDEKKWKDGVKSIENDLYYNIDMSFTHLKKEYPTLESQYEKKTTFNKCVLNAIAAPNPTPMSTLGKYKLKTVLFIL